MKTKLAAVILNYKRLDDTLSCLSALKKSDQGKRVEYYVVDNTPTQKTAQLFKKSYKDIHYLPSYKNRGFAGGNNIAIRKIIKRGFTHTLIINPDVTVQKRFFTPLLKNFNDKKVGIVAPAISHKQNKINMISLEGKIDWKYAKPEHRVVRSIKSKKPIQCDFVTFACVLISTDTFKKIGLLNEDYFMYFEDVDFCLSANNADIRTILDPSVIISHKTSSSFKHPTQKLIISFKSHLYFIKRWLSPIRRIIPYLYACIVNPYLYLLWTYHEIKYGNK